ncbi:MAG TPA: TonB-dependent receptor [Terriglobia bacterium]|nr:TonB-dependent receptor [Terriglobia bacterium]
MTRTLRKQAGVVALLGIALGLSWSIPSAAQTFSGSIGGIVKDASGAVIPGVKVSVTNIQTGVVTNTVANDDGDYVVSFLPPSAYTVSFSKSGFHKLIQANIRLVMNQHARVDAALAVGSATQIVTVKATATELNRISGTIGGTISSTDLVQLPQNVGTHGGSALNNVKVFAGLSSSSPNYGNPNNISYGGGLAVNTPIITDGLISNVNGFTYGFVPTPNSTEELQVLTSPYSAEYGFTGGGEILTTTKSGTEIFHGNLFEFHSDQTLNALDFFNTRATSKPEDIYNYFGGSLGGPVYIPGIWNGRKTHTYFFTDWEDTLTLQSKLDNTDVPTIAERNGDFSGFTPQGTATPAIYNPATTQIVNGAVVRQVFPGNKIPQTSIDPIAAKILSFYPQPTCNLPPFNYCVDPVGYSSYLYNTEKVDQAIGNYDRVWGRFATDGPWSGAAEYIPNSANTSFLNGWRDWHGEGSWSHMFSPSVANEFRFGYVDENNFTRPPTNDVASLGIPGVPLSQFPDVSVTGLTNLGGSSYSVSFDRDWIWNDSLVWQKGRHTLHAGGEFLRYAEDNFTPGVLSGSYSFGNSFTTLPGSTATTGFAPAQFLLGLPTSGSISTNNYEFRLRENAWDLYLQDDFKVTGKLTIDPGLRWEFDGPPSEINGQMYTFNPTLTDPTTGKPGAVEFAGINGAPNHFLPNIYHGVLPRFGFAYALPDSTVVRGGFGTYETQMIEYVDEGEISKYSRSCNFTAANNYTAPFEMDQGPPSCPFNVNAQGEPNIPTSLTKPTSSVTWLESDANMPTLMEWSVGLQHQFAHGWFGEVDYEGNRGYHLPVNLPMNQIPGSLLQPGVCCNGIANAQALRPYPQFNNVTYFSFSGTQSYNALLAQMQHHWANGLSTLFTYTWARNMNDVDAPNRSDGVAIQNVDNIAADWGDSMLDIPQRFTATFVYMLPIGAGSKLLAGVPVVSQAVGHWEITGITQFQKGYPYFISQTNTTGLFNGAQYVTMSGSPYLSNPTLAEWFDTKAFNITPPDTFGNAPRAAFFGPGQNNWDISVMRNFPVKERVTLQFRADFYNAFNHPQYDNLNTNIASPAFGEATGDIGPRTIQLDARLSF